MKNYNILKLASLLTILLAVVIIYFSVIAPLKSEISELRKQKPVTMEEIQAAIADMQAPDELLREQQFDIHPGLVVIPKETKTEKQKLNDSTSVNITYRPAQVFYNNKNKLADFNNLFIITKQDTIKTR